ncbi:MAG: hypothetical protein HUU03_09175 [Planctomycetaceae bacterium]|nr:hypothetical protein [Planctomycetota bacterium]NUO16596.1 hypothetical protein [Planctomycetaceae bacterium]GIK52233.1 MAG: hypothetical protein BroJett014_12060 [Planctomycetota bacterium]
MTNRIQKDSPQDEPLQGTHVVQTPFGVFHVVIALTPGQPDPMAFAMKCFEEAVQAGATDPLLATLQRLKAVAQSGAGEPLQAGIALLSQMCAAGVLPPLETLLGAAGFAPEEIARLMGRQEGTIDLLRKRADDVNLN